MAIPKKLRIDSSKTFVVTRGYEQCLIVVDEHHWENLVNQINKNPLLKMDVRDTKRYLLGGASEFEPDSQGRFVIPDALRDFANIEKEVVFLGVGEWIEIWGKQQWDERLENLTGNASEIADRLSI